MLELPDVFFIVACVLLGDLIINRIRTDKVSMLREILQNQKKIMSALQIKDDGEKEK